MHAAAHNYTTHKSMYTWVVIADANWCSGLLSSEKRRVGPLLQKFLLPAIVPPTPLANVKSALTSLSQITWLQNNLKYSVQSRKLSHKYVATGCSVQKVLVKILPTTSESEG